MAITEESRHHLYRTLESTLGREDATVLMEHLPPIGWADVATKTDLGHLETVMSKDLAALALAMRADIGENFNRLLFQLLAAQAAFTTVVLLISRTT